MTYEVVIMPRALEDVHLASAWYTVQSPELGTKFLDAFDDAVRHIRRFPLVHRNILKGARRVSMPPFKYHVYYKVKGNKIFIATILHAHRNPREWKRRLR